MTWKEIEENPLGDVYPGFFSMTIGSKKINICPTISKAQYHLPSISEVIFNEEGKTTIVRWGDNQKTIVHCGEGETFDRYTGFMACICKRLFGGTTTAKKFMNSVDRKYQASLRAAKEEKVKAKRIAEMKEAQERAKKRRAQEELEDFDAMVKFMVRKMRAEEVAKNIVAGNLPFDGDDGADV